MKKISRVGIVAIFATIIFISGSAAASWVWNVPAVDVSIGFDNPLVVDIAKLTDNVTVTDRDFEAIGSYTVHAREDCTLTSMSVTGLSEEEKEYFEVLHLDAAGHPVNLLTEESWEMREELQKGVTDEVELILTGRVKEYANTNQIDFKFEASFSEGV